MWYKQSQILYGEYWIDDGGQVEYADGDIGEKGHAQYVVEAIINRHNYSYEKIMELLNTNYPLEDGSKDIYQHLKRHGFSLQEAILVTDGMNGNGYDKLLEFAMKKLGWKRVEGSRVETWTLTPNDLQLIVTGLNDIAQEDENGESKWTIEVASTRKVYMNIPLNVLEKGPRAIISYDNTASVHPMSLPNNVQAMGWYNKIKTAQFKE